MILSNNENNECAIANNRENSANQVVEMFRHYALQNSKAQGVNLESCRRILGRR